jgi:hypothetical protein
MGCEEWGYLRGLKLWLVNPEANPCQRNGFETLHDVFEVLHATVAATHYSSPELDGYLHTGGINYGTCWGRSFELVTPKGNVARKAFHVTVERTERGLYNLNCSIL